MLSLKAAVKTRRIRSFAVKFAVLGGIVIVLGFMGFLWLLPSQEVVLDRSSDGIVVLTGGTSRVIDGLELLAAGRGKRLLITGVTPERPRPISRGRSPATTACWPAASTSTIRRSTRWATPWAHAAGPWIALFIRSSSSPPPITCRGRAPRSRTSFPMSR